MDNGKEYITITQLAEELDWNKATVYDWIKTLGIEKHRFVRNKNTFLHITDVERLREIKEKPWLAGPNTARTERQASRIEKEPLEKTMTISEKPQPAKPQNRNVEPKRPYLRKNTLPEGCILSTEFARGHGLSERTFRDHMNIGLGPGLAHGADVPEDGSVLVKDWIRFEERIRRVRKDGTIEKERYLTSEQQAGAIAFWRRWDVNFSQCDRPDCPCH
jgi:hypothetical protein